MFKKCDLIEFSYISIFYHHSRDFQAHPSLSTETINSIEKQGKPQVVFVLFTLQNTQNNLHNTLKNNIHKVHLSSVFINLIKTLKINDLHKKITHNMIWSNPRNWCNETKIPQVTSSKNVCSFITLFKFMSVFKYKAKRLLLCLVFEELFSRLHFS